MKKSNNKARRTSSTHNPFRINQLGEMLEFLSHTFTERPFFIMHAPQSPIANSPPSSPPPSDPSPISPLILPSLAPSAPCLPACAHSRSCAPHRFPGEPGACPTYGQRREASSFLSSQGPPGPPLNGAQIGPMRHVTFPEAIWYTLKMESLTSPNSSVWGELRLGWKIKKDHNAGVRSGRRRDPGIQKSDPQHVGKTPAPLPLAQAPGVSVRANSCSSPTPPADRCRRSHRRRT